MWKDPLPDCSLSSATLGLRPPFSAPWGAGLNPVRTPIESCEIVSQEVQRRACRRLEPGAVVGRRGRGRGKDSEMCSWEIWICL